MTTFYIILKVSALLAILVLPLFGPKKRKVKAPEGLSSLSVNDNGKLEHFTNATKDHTLVQ